VECLHTASRFEVCSPFTCSLFPWFSPPQICSFHLGVSRPQLTFNSWIDSPNAGSVVFPFPFLDLSISCGSHSPPSPPPTPCFFPHLELSSYPCVPSFFLSFIRSLTFFLAREVRLSPASNDGAGSGQCICELSTAWSTSISPSPFRLPCYACDSSRGFSVP